MLWTRKNATDTAIKILKVLKAAKSKNSNDDWFNKAEIETDLNKLTVFFFYQSHFVSRPTNAKLARHTEPVESEEQMAKVGLLLERRGKVHS